MSTINHVWFVTAMPFKLLKCLSLMINQESDAPTIGHGADVGLVRGQLKKAVSAEFVGILESAMTEPVDKAKGLALELAASTGVIASVGVTGE